MKVGIIGAGRIAEIMAKTLAMMEQQEAAKCAGRQKNGKDQAVSDTAGEGTVGKDTVGKDTAGEDTVGENTVGKDTAGEGTVGKGTVGKDTAGEGTAGESTVGSEAVGQKAGEGAMRWAIGSRDLKKAEAFAERFGFPRAYGSYEELVNDPEVDLVYIATPHSHHYEHMKLCIEHGKPVLCEKSFTVNAAQAEEILRFAKERGVFVAEAIWTRYQPMRQIITETLASGIIGEPHLLTGALGYPSTNYERLVRPELAGGALLDLGVYVLNFAAMFFGDDIVRTSSVATLLDTGVDAQNNITLEYSNGNLAILGSSIIARTDRTGVISGTRGRLEVFNVNTMQHLAVYDLNDQLVLDRPCPPMLTGYEYEVQCCAEALANGWLEHPLMPHSEIIRIMRQMDELRRQWGVKYSWD